MQPKLVSIALAVSVVSTLVVASLVNCSDDNGIPDYYLTIPSESRFLRDKTYEALIKDTRPAGLEAQKMLENFDQQIAASAQPYEIDLYREMRKLADPAKAECNFELVNYILEILTLAKEHPDKPVFSNYVNYVKTYGKAYFDECLKDSEDKFRWFNRKVLSADNKSCLNNFFLDYFGLEPRVYMEPMAEELYRRAKSVCLLRDDLRVEQTLVVAKFYRFRNYAEDASPAEILQIFVGDMCRIFGEPQLRQALEIIYLGEALGAKLPDEFSVEHLKLVEFDRICIAWNKGDKTRPGLEVAPEAPEKAPVDGKKLFKFFD